MLLKITKIAAFFGGILMLYSCSTNKNHQNVITTRVEPVTTVLSAQERAKLTPDQILEDLKEGNNRFRNNNSTQRDHSAQIRNSAVGQFPKAFVLSCVDSRIPVEDIFDQGLGDVFVGRVAGNFINEDLLGSMEFACKVAGAKLILVMGHQHCGAIKGAIDNVKLGNLTNLLSKINPAIAMSQDFTGEKKSANEDYVRHVSQNNVKNAINNIRLKSPVLREMEAKGEIKIKGAFYILTKGELIILDDLKNTKK
ncbi:MAG: carbonic anhydrase family protein [Ferruginibacter sp.]